MDPYFTVEIPWEPDASKRTSWHPYQATGPFSVLTRGAFALAGEADQWARQNLGQTSYTIKLVDPLAIQRCQIEWIDHRARPTPDSNQAVCIAVSEFAYLDGSRRIVEYRCCAEHARQLAELVSRGWMQATAYASRWLKRDLPGVAP